MEFLLLLPRIAEIQISKMLLNVSDY